MSFFVPIQRTKFPHATKAKAYAFGSSEPVELKGKFEVLVYSKGRVAAATFYVTRGTTPILGCETATNLRLITMNVNDVSKASKLASDSGTDTNINTDVPPVAQKTGVFHFIYANS